MAVAVAHESSGFPDRTGFAAKARWVWPFVVLAVIGLAALLAVYGHAEPAFDANGWLTWGRQLWHGNFNLYGAPSWKPLTFIFTFPYALAGHRGELWLWILTACATGLGAPLMAGRLAWRLSPPGEGWMPSWLPRALAAFVACAITVTMTVATKSTPVTAGYLKQMLTTLSDPLDTFICLVAVDRALSRRFGWTLFLVWLAALGRPEVWPFLGIYGIWAWFKVPGLRRWAVLSILSMPVAWFLAPALASHSWNSASQFDQGLGTAIHGDKALGVLNRLRTLSGRAVQIEVGVAILVVLIRRDRRALVLIGLALAWVIVEIAFALHGLSAVQRYIMEPAALLAVVGGVGVAHALAWPSWRRIPFKLVGVVAVIGFLVACEPFAHATVRAGRNLSAIQLQTDRAKQHLDRLITEAGGAERIKACGTPDVTLGWQSALAWQLRMNVGDVGFFYYAPHLAADAPPTVVFNRDGFTGWRLTVTNVSQSCAGLQGLTT